jgi:hypothetical protein
VPCRRGGVDLEIHQQANGVECVTKQEARSLDRPEEVADDGKCRTFDLPEKHGRSTSLVDPPLDGRNLEMRVNLFFDHYELTGRLQVGDACRERTISHQAGPSMKAGNGFVSKSVVWNGSSAKTPFGVSMW